eukprot:3271141-Prymnesium_polylepis.2
MGRYASRTATGAPASTQCPLTLPLSAQWCGVPVSPARPPPSAPWHKGPHKAERRKISAV